MDAMDQGVEANLRESKKEQSLDGIMERRKLENYANEQLKIFIQPGKLGQCSV